MANHCEKLVKKLTEKIFKIPIVNNTSATATLNSNTNTNNNSSNIKSSK
jgi:hypothetical protein